MRVLMVGLGDIARKAYLPVLAARADVELHLVTRDRGTLDSVAGRYRVPHRYTTIAEALGSGRYDAAFVHAATPAHPELARTLIEAGVPTFVDKPLADNLSDAEAIVGLAARHGTPLTVGFNRRFAPDYAALRGVRGNLITMEKHRHRQPDETRRVIFDDFIHVVDTLLFLAPGAVERQAIEVQVEGGLLRAVTLLLGGDGFSAVGTMHRDSGLDEERLDMIGAGVRRSVLNLSDRLVSDGTQHRHRRGDWMSVAQQRGFDAMCDDFLAAARERRQVDDVAILRTHALCEAIVRHADAR